MLMKEQCFICTKDLSNINSILDAKYVKYSWRPHFEENKYILYFSKQNLWYLCSLWKAILYVESLQKQIKSIKK